MNILWAGGEDIDFLTLNGANITTANARAGWSRVMIQMPNSANIVARSLPFSGGAVTSAWLSFRLFYNYPSANLLFAGFGLSGTSNWLGVGGNGTQLQLCTYNGGTRTLLSSEIGATLISPAMNRIDMQVTNYGASATVNVYLNSNLVISFTGDVRGTGMTNFDSVFIVNGPNYQPNYFSEFIVADSDTRALLGLQTLALTGAGTTAAWTNNTYTNINGTIFSDTNPTYVNTAAADQEYTVGPVTPQVCSVVAVVQNARMAASAGSTPTHVKMGYGSAGAGYFGSGAQKTPGVGFAPYQQIDQTNPITGVAFTRADLTAPLQLDLQSV
jgi:hypothetical protein